MALFGTPSSTDTDDYYLDEDETFGAMVEATEPDEVDGELDELEAELDAELGYFGATGLVTTGKYLPPAAPYFVPAPWRDLAGGVRSLFEEDSADIVNYLNQAIGGAMADAPQEQLAWPGGMPASFGDRDADTVDQVMFFRKAVWGAATNGDLTRATHLAAKYHVPAAEDAWVGELREILNKSFAQNDVEAGGVRWIGMESGLPGVATLSESVADSLGGTEDDYNGLAIALFFMDKMGFNPYQMIIGDLNSAEASGEDVMMVSTTAPAAIVEEVEEGVIVEYPEDSYAPPGVGMVMPRPETILAIGYAVMTGPSLVRAIFRG